MQALKSHPSNPHGVLVPCANCGKEIHVPRAELEGERIVHLADGRTKIEGPMNPARITCSYDCMTALRSAGRRS